MKMNFSRIWVYLVVINSILIQIVLFAGCNTQGNPNRGEPTVGIQQTTHVTSLTKTIEIGKIPEIEESPPTLTITPLPFEYLYKNCIPLSATESINQSGNFIIWPDNGDKILLRKPDGTVVKILPHTSVIVTSPDLTKFAYIQDSPHSIVIFSSDGRKLQEQPIPEDWVWPLDWISEDQIYIEKRLDFPESSTEPGILISFNLETGDYEEFPPDFPGIVPWVERSQHYWVGNMTFLPDPTLKYAVYALKDGHIVLWDVESESEVMRIYDRGQLAGGPVWSKGGEWFVVQAPVSIGTLKNWEDELPDEYGYDLYRVYTNGELRRLTYFSTLSYSQISGISLSPDESKIAFWVDITSDRDDYRWQLGVLDISTGNVKRYCESAGSTPYPSIPIWSPSGDGLMVNNYDVNWQSPPVVSTIDLSKDYISILREDALGLGWLSLVGDNESEINSP